MPQLSLPDISKKMKDIDFVMFTTRTQGGELAARPMSNNGDVEYDGDSWFFALDDARVVSDIRQDAKVGLSMQGNKGLLGKPPLFLSIEGQAELIREKAAFEEHWTHDMDRWAKQGADTPGLVLIKVHATRVHYWDGEDEGEIVV
ncbi:MAG: pyridoxamine 5'-phosphate oxidase family protein [Phenylobacterium sp.]|uniref:pyridoxamine 5'-phosphate oxidase family protein n=1 Tax=Phenylobacterium sp. TaxID=1871053 RepID=UPI002735814D|nr:pyridoxamine 5'-phosphate oxidase family protein [Phenylobacterium sp.]MDP3174995.1 pyridoxamine 5'-phosphate oxidase family protein [Phenylobacterium sp.]